MMETVGFIGLGQMGRGMALNLQKKAGGIHVFDISQTATSQLVGAGAQNCNSAAELALQCRVIILCLPTEREVDALIFGPHGLLAGATPDSIVVDSTTMDRNAAVSLSERANLAGLDYCDCPVSGLPKRADAGTLISMVGGTKAAFDRVRPTLEMFSQTVLHCGGIGSGQTMKAINNIIYDINIAALCEVLPLAVAGGLDPVQLTHVVTSGSSNSFVSKHFVPRMLARQFSNDFPLQQAVKDIKNIQQLQADTGAHLPLVTAMIESYEAALAAGYGAEPKSAMLKIYEAVLDVQFAESQKAEI